jgi:hypothetical protein
VYSRLAVLSIFLLLLSALTKISDILERRQFSALAQSVFQNSNLISTARIDPEGTLALGERLSLRHAQQADLELIPGIGTTLALNLLELQAERAAPQRPIKKGNKIRKPKKSAQASKQASSDCDWLTKAHGIGQKTALRLCEYLRP